MSDGIKCDRCYRPAGCSEEQAVEMGWQRKLFHWLCPACRPSDRARADAQDWTAHPKAGGSQCDT